MKIAKMNAGKLIPYSNIGILVPVKKFKSQGNSLNSKVNETDSDKCIS